jgi:NAD dependent epimerase/dehydratase family enzyme
LKQMLLPFRLGLGGKQGSGKQWMSWIAIDDHIAALRCAIDDERLRGAVDFTAPNPVTNADFAHALGRALHRPTVLPTPMFPLKLRYGAELVDALLLAGQRVLPARLEAIGFPFRYPVLAPALEAILQAG